MILLQCYDDFAKNAGKVGKNRLVEVLACKKLHKSEIENCKYEMDQMLDDSEESLYKVNWGVLREHRVPFLFFLFEKNRTTSSVLMGSRLTSLWTK